MNDLIKELASDPSCLLAITPEAGGSWLAPFRTRQPRDFAANPMTFTDSYTAQDGIGTDDFTLSVDFTLLRENVHGTINIGCMQCVYYYSTKSYLPSVQILKTDGTKDKFFPVGTMHITEDVASITVIKTGQNVRMVVYARDGSTVRDLTKPLPDGATVTSSSGATTYPGNISAASIRNDTTGEIVWQAAHSDLYDTSNPWPSSVLRNFAEEPATWYNAKAWFESAPTGNMTFDFEFEQLSVPISGKTWLLSNGGRCPFGCEWIIASADRFAFRIYFYGLYDTGAIPAPYLQVILNASTVLGKHLVHAEASDGLFTVTMDGATVTSTKVGSRLTGSFTGVQETTADCTIKRLSISVPGYRRFDYPSEAERVRLLTYDNVRTDRGVFEAVDTSKTARVDTALDLRGKISDYTLFVEFDAAALENESDNYCKQELAGQGASKGSIPSPLAVNYNKQLNVDTLEYRLEVSVDIAGARHLSEAILPGHLAGRNSVVAVVELMDDKTRLSIYHCGVLLKSEIVDGIPKMDGYACPNSFALMDNRNGLWSNYYGKIHSCLLFDRALSAEEIALYSKIANS